MITKLNIGRRFCERCATDITNGPRTRTLCDACRAESAASRQRGYGDETLINAAIEAKNAPRRWRMDVDQTPVTESDPSDPIVWVFQIDKGLPTGLYPYRKELSEARKLNTRQYRYRPALIGETQVQAFDRLVCMVGGRWRWQIIAQELAA